MQSQSRLTESFAPFPIDKLMQVRGPWPVEREVRAEIFYATILVDHGLAVLDTFHYDPIAFWFVLVPGYTRVRYPLRYAYAAIDSAIPTIDQARDAVIEYQLNQSLIWEQSTYLAASVAGESFEYRLCSHHEDDRLLEIWELTSGLPPNVYPPGL